MESINIIKAWIPNTFHTIWTSEETYASGLPLCQPEWPGRGPAAVL